MLIKETCIGPMTGTLRRSGWVREEFAANLKDDRQEAVSSQGKDKVKCPRGGEQLIQRPGSRRKQTLPKNALVRVSVECTEGGCGGR